MGLFDDDLSVAQIKKLKRRIVSWIWDSTPRQAIKVALICGIKIPKKLLDKYANQDQD